MEKEKENILRYLKSAQEQFQKNIEVYQVKRENGVKNLRKEMELKIRTEIHEIEERKNHHINDLIKNHEMAFKELKAFYNSTTMDNLNIIRTQKKEISKLQTKHKDNRRQLDRIREVNKDLRVKITRNANEARKTNNVASATASNNFKKIKSVYLI